jgi:membrane fusion protein (multidrug efflux system)
MPDGSVPTDDVLSRAAAGANRRRMIFALAAFVALAALVLAVSAFIAGAGKVHTDNAYIRADISVLSAEVQGYVRAVRVNDNQPVKAGDPLVEIDPSDYEARVAYAKAALARAKAQLASGAAERSRASADYARYGRLTQQGIYSRAGMDAIRASAAQAAASTEAAAAEIQAAKADLETAELNLQRTIVRAPVDGVIGNRVVQPGQLVRPGVQLLSVVPLRDVYVIANFKETQITAMRPGQKAAIKVDAFPNLKLDGVVDSFSPASGSQFSILPQDTATGNFTKITQRVPVKIRLAMTPEAQGLLRPGLSVVATVDTKAKP